MSVWNVEIFVENSKILEKKSLFMADDGYKYHWSVFYISILVALIQLLKNHGTHLMILELLIL